MKFQESMDGNDLVKWRERNGYSQEELMREVGIKSRQTMSAMENNKTLVPRMLVLALIALEGIPESRAHFGKKAKAKDEKKFIAGGKR
jgi:transcriptional regulator with XRE-family HTH domain